MLTAGGPDEFTRGSKEDRLRNYFEVLRRFLDSIEPEHLEAGEMISDLIVAPESLMRGYFRRATGPGWALLGDALHFKHPGTAQGIGDAVAQGGLRRGPALQPGSEPGRLRGLARGACRRALRLVVRLGTLSAARALREALSRLGERPRRRSGHARHAHPQGRALRGDERGAAHPLVRRCRP